MVIFVHMHGCVRGEGGRPWATGIFMWLCHSWLTFVPQPISFCILKKQANRSVWFIFWCLIHHFLVRHLVAKCSFHSSVRKQGHAEVGGWWKRPLSARRKSSKLVQLTFREEYRVNLQFGLRVWNRDLSSGLQLGLGQVLGMEPGLHQG